jgi:Ca2+-binding EF-hand superfamily protein
LRQFCECEISIELVRQQITNKLGIRSDQAFNALDREQKGYATLDDFREFIKGQNMYPTEKNLALLFERFNKSGNKAVTFEEYQ